jgi:hypothetical protein
MPGCENLLILDNLSWRLDRYLVQPELEHRTMDRCLGNKFRSYRDSNWREILSRKRDNREGPGW